MVLFLFLVAAYVGYGQEHRTHLKGSVNNLKNDVSNVLIINLNTKQSTITDSLGLFSIAAKLKDSIRITAVQYLRKDILITDSILKANIWEVNLVENIINLNEVTVSPYNLTGTIALDIDRLDIKPEVSAKSLGLPNADLIKMTQSERLFIEADRGNYFNFYVVALTINTHKIMNRLSGRTKSFEEMVERDEKMNLEKEIIAKFSKETMCNNFKISKANIDGFLTYCLSQEDFLSLAEVGNSVEVWEYLKAKSVAFKKTESIVE